MALEKKTTKKQSGYDLPVASLVDQEGKGLRCDTCYFWQGGKCKIVKGSIEPEAACNLYSTPNNGKLNLEFVSGKEATLMILQGKLFEKEQAGYYCGLPTALRPLTPKAFSCGTCFYFHPSDGKKNVGGCELVKGTIGAYSCCNLYDPSTQNPKKKYDFASSEEIKATIHVDIEDLVCPAFE